VVMRRMTKVSPYPYWHFFDAYPPGYLRAVYRGNGIPLPWGNLAQVSDPCPHWAVFRMIDDEHGLSGSQISVLRDGERSLLYCCHSRRVRDMAGNPHVLSVGVDLAPALALRLAVALAPATAERATGTQPAVDGEAERASIETWRAERIRRLTSDTGWLTLTGLFWLKEGENSFGRSSSNALVLDNPSLADTAGSFVLHDHRVRFVARPGGGVTHDGHAVGSLDLVADTQGEPT